MKKILKASAIVLVATYIFFIQSTNTQAVVSCGPNPGFCMVSGQDCPGGTIVPDGSCNSGAYNGTACCVVGGRGDNFDDPDDAINPVEAPTNETFDALNPLKVAGGETIDDEVASEFADQLSTPGGIVTRVLVFIFPLAGLILFLMISWGGFEILMGAGDSSKVTAGKQRLTAAIVGFLILFASYWMVQIMEV
ncbi:MAG: SoxR reducing system RseC family protein, partial [Candidatus Pacebacteria bacterium]|nr:SoxR reducing system RseC family protein [Candidatus Paceibacterota bacterium]